MVDITAMYLEWILLNVDRIPTGRPPSCNHVAARRHIKYSRQAREHQFNVNRPTLSQVSIKRAIDNWRPMNPVKQYPISSPLMFLKPQPSTHINRS
jgi:hypothetical protein